MTETDTHQTTYDRIDLPDPDALDDPDQAWYRHLRSEREWRCPDHGLVDAGPRQHGGRSRARQCPRDGCRWTLTNVDVDWDAYHEARENDEAPPCPRCDSEAIDKVPASTPFRCTDCGHAFGYAGGYF